MTGWTSFTFARQPFAEVVCNCSGLLTEKAPGGASSDSFWWSGCPDSNWGPLGPKPSALTWLSYTPMTLQHYTCARSSEERQPCAATLVAQAL